MAQVTTNILLIIITAGVGFTFAIIKLGISRLVKGQDEAKVEGMNRVNKIRDDIKNIDIKVSTHSERLAILETRLEIHEDRDGEERRKTGNGRRSKDNDV